MTTVGARASCISGRPHCRIRAECNLDSKLSRRNNQGLLKEFFRYCRKSKWIEENPAEDLGTIRIKKNEQIKTDPFSPGEMQRVFAALDAALETEYTRRRIRALILAQRHAGLSIEDVVILPRTGVVEEKNCHRVITDRKKTGAHIDNVIPARVGRELLSVPNRNPKYLLCETVEGEPIGEWQIAVDIDGPGRFAIDDNSNLWDDALPKFKLEYRDETAWKQIDPLMRRISTDKGWKTVTPQELVAVLESAGAIGVE